MYRDDFDILKNNNLIYLDSSATTLKPNSVINSITTYLDSYTANLHRGDYDNSLIVDDKVEETRNLVKNFIGGSTNKSIIFTNGATDSLNFIAFSFFKNILKKDDEIVLTYLEHASNILPWLILQEEIGFKIKFIELDEDYKVSIDKLKECINSNTKLVSLAHVTNTMGDERDLFAIGNYLDKLNIYFVVDAAQSISHFKIDVEKSKIDFLAFSSHKMFGSTGTGVLYVKEKHLDYLKPFRYGGGQTLDFDMNEIIYKDYPYKFEAGTLDISGIISLGEAVKYINSKGINNLHNYIKELSKYLFDSLKDIPGIKIYNKYNESGILIFNIDNYFPQDVSVYLNKHKICIRTGDNCVKMLDKVIGTRKVCRVSLSIYNTKEDIDKLREALLNKEDILKEII